MTTLIDTTQAEAADGARAHDPRCSSPAMALARADRPQAADDLGRALRRFLADTDSGDIERKLGSRVKEARALAKRQKPNGCWINDKDQWMEGDPNLVTAYALLALAYTRKK